MKLFFDHNLPPRIVSRLSDLFPDSEHVFTPGLDRAHDVEIREYAQREDLVIVTKDVDFSDLCVLRGFPPKVIWIRRGNCSANDLEQLLREHHAQIVVEYRSADRRPNVVLSLGKEVIDAADGDGGVFWLSGEA